MFNFDEKIDRKNTNCVKWDMMRELYYDHQEMLPFWVADMDIAVPKAITEAIIKRAGHAVYGYELVNDDYYQAIISWLKRRHGVSIDKEDIVFSPGIVTGLYTAVAAFSKVGDHIVVQKPVYYPFFNAVNDQKRVLVSNNLKRVDNHYEIDFVDLEEKLSKDNVTMMIFCSPHNPVGRVWRKEEISKVAELCLKHNVVLVSDEIHSDIVFNGHVHHSLLNERTIDDILICLNAPSKTFNIAGLYSGYAIIRNQEKREAYNAVKTTWHQTSINPFSCAATIAAYNECEAWNDELNVYLYENYLYFKKSVEQNCPKLKVLDLEGTYLVLLDYRELGISADEMQIKLTQEAHVALQRGEQFCVEGHVRVNLGTRRENVIALVDRLTTVFK